MSRLWLYLGTIPAVMALAFGAFQVVGVLAHEEFTVVTHYDEVELTGLRVDNENGPVEIIGTDTSSITVEARVSRGLQATGHEEQIVGDTLVLEGTCPLMPVWCDVSYRIEIPRHLAVAADVDNGRLTIRDVTGPVEVDGDNGRIELLRLAGDVRASNDNGRIEGVGLRSSNVDTDTDNGRVTLVFAAAPDFVTAGSDNGSVEIVVPDDADYRVDARTDNGSTDVGVRTDPSSERSITARTDNGSVTVRYP